MNEGNYECKLARRGNELGRMVLQRSFRQDKNMSRDKTRMCGITNFGSGEIFLIIMLLCVLIDLRDIFLAIKIYEFTFQM